MKFTKWHGQGNDFIIVNGMEEHIVDFSRTAIAVCDRHFGIGADGLVVLLPADTTADFRMRIFNSDGSEAEMCGNATRCVARYVYEQGLTTKTRITLQTMAGSIVPELLFDAGRFNTIRVDMGQPRITRAEIPMTGDPSAQAVSVPVEVDGQVWQVTSVSMGNPHAVVFVDNLAAVNLPVVGLPLETHPMLPRKTNVEFVEVLNREEMRMRVWERGAGITLACGTGASAVLVASVLNGKTGRRAVIHLDGGDLHIEWGHDNHVYMSGPAVEVFRGTYLQEV